MFFINIFITDLKMPPKKTAFFGKSRKAQYVARARDAETEEERNIRRQADAKSHAVARLQETETQRQTRLINEAERRASTRLQETETPNCFNGRRRTEQVWITTC